MLRNLDTIGDSMARAEKEKLAEVAQASAMCGAGHSSHSPRPTSARLVAMPTTREITPYRTGIAVS